MGPRSASVPAGPASTGETPRAAPPEALYVHVPFCLSLCPYCDFVVYAGAAARGPKSRVGAYLAALAVELDLRADALDAAFGPPEAPRAKRPASPGRPVPAAPSARPDRRPALGSLYLGGGTPSLLPADSVAAIVDRVRDRFGLADGAEVTLEANPGPDDRGDLTGFARAGVTRISFGAQSLDAAELRALGRRHAPEDVADAVAAARDAGIVMVNLDLLYDLPGQRVATFARTLDLATELAPEHVSLYALTLDDPDAEGLTGPDGDHLPTTPGARRWRERARRRQDEDGAAACYAYADGRLAEAGLAWYEISNWALPGAESRHNLAYWRRRPHEAAGPGAHAFDGAARRWNAARLEGWLTALVPAGGAPPALPPGGAEVLDAATAATEALVLALRLAEGVPRRTMVARPDGFAWAAGSGLVEEAPGDRVRLTLRGRLLSNELFARLL
jgi:coproporphyrinogen III oxidase-like Fe-S oxidoreductase